MSDNSIGLDDATLKAIYALPESWVERIMEMLNYNTTRGQLATEISRKLEEAYLKGKRDAYADAQKRIDAIVQDVTGIEPKKFDADLFSPEGASKITESVPFQDISVESLG